MLMAGPSLQPALHLHLPALSSQTLSSREGGTSCQPRPEEIARLVISFVTPDSLLLNRNSGICKGDRITPASFWLPASHRASTKQHFHRSLGTLGVRGEGVVGWGRLRHWEAGGVARIGRKELNAFVFPVVWENLSVVGERGAEVQQAVLNGITLVSPRNALPCFLSLLHHGTKLTCLMSVSKTAGQTLVVLLPWNEVNPNFLYGMGVPARSSDWS